MLRELKQPSQWLPILCLGIMWLMLLTPPFCPTYLTIAGNGQLDFSWQYSNGYFLQKGMRAGVDYIFPTGLLSYFYAYFWGGIYIRALFWWYFLWQLASRSFFAYNLWRMCARYPDYRLRALIFLACGFVLATTEDVFYIALLLTISDVLISRQPYSGKRLVLNVVVLSLVACLKFTLLVYGILIILVASWAHYVAKRPKLLSPVLVFTLSFALIWLSLGQHLSDFPLYMKNSMAVSSGYSAAMATQGDGRITLLGLLELCLIALWMVKFRPPFSHANSNQSNVNTANIHGSNSNHANINHVNICGCLVLGMFLLFLWKHGFVRNDPHALFCFGSVLFFALVLPVSFQEYTRLPLGGRGLLFGCVALSLLGYGMVWKDNEWKHQIKTLLARPLKGAAFAFTPWLLEQRLDREREYERKLWNLPAITHIVKDNSIDVFSYDQMTVLLNEFRYHPRPVYQGYVAFSEYLIDYNARFYRSENAPHYVLFKLQTTDNRYPTLDDNQALLEILRRYRPIETEKSYILFARNPTALSPPTNLSTGETPVGKATPDSPSHFVVPLDQEVEIKDGAAAHLLRVDVHSTGLGKLRDALVRPAEMHIVVTTEDGNEHAYRFIPAMTTRGFLLDPLVQSNEDVLLLYGNQRGKRVRKFRITLAAHAGLWLQNRVEVTLIPQSCVALAHLQPSLLKRLLAPERLADPKPLPF